MQIFSQMKKGKNKETHFPIWLKYLLYLSALLYLLWILFLKKNIQRDDFPFF